MARAARVGPAVSFLRTGGATYFDSSGVLQTAGTDEARFNHDPVTGEALGLLLEDAQRNDCLQSENLLTTWTNPGANTVITSNIGSTLDGLVTADDVLHGDSAETIQQTITSDDDTVYTVSAFVRQGLTGAHDWVKMSWMDQSAGTNGFEAWFNIANGTVGTAQATGTGSYTAGSARISDMGGGWWRIEAAGQIVAGSTDARFEIINTTADAVDTAETTNSVFWWGLQVESSLFVTMYIKTTTVAVTRNAETANVALGSWYTQAAGTWVVRYNFHQADPGGTTNFTIWRAEENGTNYMLNRIVNAASIRSGRVFNGGVSQASLRAPGQNTANATHSIAFSFEDDNFKMNYDGAGGGVDEDTAGTVPIALTTLFLGQTGAGSQSINGHIQRMTFFDRTHSFPELAALSAI